MVFKAVSKGTKIVGQRRYLTGVTSGTALDGDGDRMMPQCIASFERQANEKPILLFPGPHEGPYLDDLGILTFHEIQDNGDWYTEFRLYDEQDGVDQKTLDAANKLWKKATGAPPYTMPCPIGFSIEGREANVHERNNGKDFYDIVLHGVVAVPEPAYQDAEAVPVMKSKEKVMVNKYKKLFDVHRPVDQARFDDGSRKMILGMLNQIGDVVAKSQGPAETAVEVDLILDAYKESQIKLIEECRPEKEGVFKSMALLFSRKPKAARERLGTVIKSRSGAIYEKTDKGWELKLEPSGAKLGTVIKTKKGQMYERVENGWKRVEKAPLKPGTKRVRGGNVYIKQSDGKWKYSGRDKGNGGSGDSSSNAKGPKKAPKPSPQNLPIKPMASKPKQQSSWKDVPSGTFPDSLDQMSMPNTPETKRISGVVNQYMKLKKVAADASHSQDPNGTTAEYEKARKAFDDYRKGLGPDRQLVTKLDYLYSQGGEGQAAKFLADHLSKQESRKAKSPSKPSESKYDNPPPPIPVKGSVSPEERERIRKIQAKHNATAPQSGRVSSRSRPVIDVTRYSGRSWGR